MQLRSLSSTERKHKNERISRYKRKSHLVGNLTIKKGALLLRMSAVKRNAEEDLQPDGTKKQFTAATLLKSAYESSQNELKPADVRIADLDELAYFQRRKRTEYENALRRNRFNYGQWMRYAQFEIDQKDIRRARSVFERALEVDYKNVAMWVRYIQTEIKQKNINHARNLLERATYLLPRIDKLWYMYVTIEESIGNIVAVDEIFEKWLQWKPVKDVWIHYLDYQERYEEFDNERLTFEKLVIVFNDSDSWLRWVDFEKTHGDAINVANVYKLGVNSLFKSSLLDAAYMISWVQYQYANKKFNKVKELYDFGFKSLKEDEKKKLQKFQIDYEKQYGVDTEDIEVYVLQKRRITYEEKLQASPKDYETWWMYLTLLIDSSLETSETVISQKFDVSISNAPEGNEPHQWVALWYLHYRYSLWLEFDLKDVGRAQQVYDHFAGILPHKKVALIDFWLKYADFKLRNSDLTEMRKVLGQAIGFTSSEEIIKYYIDIEMKLKYFDRARKLYDKLIEMYPANWRHWMQYYEYEDSLGNEERSYSIIEISVFGDFLEKRDKIKLINAVVDKLTDNYNFKLARKLLEYKIELNPKNVDYMVQRCLFELRVPSESQLEAFENSEDPADGDLEIVIDDAMKANVRNGYERFIGKVKEEGKVQIRIILLESLKKFELQYGDPERIRQAEERLPRIVRKVRKDEIGNQEEYMEYEFPEDDKEIEEQVEEFENEFLADLNEVVDEEEDEEEEEEEEEDEDEVEEESADVDPDATDARAARFKSRFASDSEDDEGQGEPDAQGNEMKSGAPTTRLTSRFEE